MDEIRNNNNPSGQVNPSEEQEFGLQDLIAIFKRLWDKRKYVILVFGAFVVLGFAAAIFQKPVYNSRCVFVPQSSSKKGASSSLSSLAAMAGISLGDMSSAADLSPLIYPQVLNNVELKKELMRVPLHFERWDEPVSLYDLATDPAYKRFNLISAVKKYTIGLPGVILGAIRGEQPEVSVPGSGEGKSISSYTRDEYEVSKSLSRAVSMAVEKKDGYITLTATAGEALVAAELCQATFDLLQKYITNFKIQHAESTHEFIQGRYEEAKADYDAKQLALAQFADANRGAMTATAQIRREQLQSDYNLSYSLYQEMSKQLLQSEMNVKEDTPVLSPVEPVSIPMQKANSRMKTLVVWLFLGFCVAAGSVLGFDWLKKQGIKWPKNWN